VSDDFLRGAFLQALSSAEEKANRASLADGKGAPVNIADAAREKFINEKSGRR
jgi:hypothetical protein